jgi:hypothetical protein
LTIYKTIKFQQLDIPFRLLLCLRTKTPSNDNHASARPHAAKILFVCDLQQNLSLERAAMLFFNSLLFQDSGLITPLPQKALHRSQKLSFSTKASRTTFPASQLADRGQNQPNVAPSSLRRYTAVRHRPDQPGWQYPPSQQHQLIRLPRKRRESTGTPSSLPFLLAAVGCRAIISHSSRNRAHACFPPH